MKNKVFWYSTIRIESLLETKMKDFIKKILKKVIPKRVLLFYHRLKAFAAFSYGFPSTKMVVIGVTGTKGKTSTANFIWSVLMAGGIETGIISTANGPEAAKDFGVEIVGSLKG